MAWLVHNISIVDKPPKEQVIAAHTHICFLQTKYLTLISLSMLVLNSGDQHKNGNQIFHTSKHTLK